LIASIALVATVIGLVVALLAKSEYRAEAIVAAAESDGNGGALAALGGQFGDLADMAGLGVGGVFDLEQAMAIAGSREMIEGMIVDERMLPVLFSDQWDAEHNNWIEEEPSALGTARQAVSRFFVSISRDRGLASQPADRGPSAWQGYKLLYALLEIRLDRRTQLVTIACTWEEPEFAARVVQSLIVRVNREMRRRVADEARRSLVHLEGQLVATPEAELRQSLYRLIETERRKLMLADVRDEYALKVVQRALPPRERSFPNRSAMVLGSMLLGILFGMFWVLAVELWRGRL
jgi:uncharacterized protein involved in exopolysaccharide biosynthesis